MRRLGATLCAALTLAALAACSPTPDAPVVPTQVPSTSSPTASPAPNERALAAAEAKAAFVEYNRQTDLVGHRGGASQLPAGLKELTSGPERKLSLEDARDVQVNRIMVRGWSQTRNLQVVTLETDGAQPRAVLGACIDQSKMQITQDGKPFPGARRYLLVRKATLVKIQSTWKVYEIESKTLTGKLTCDDYS